MQKIIPIASIGDVQPQTTFKYHVAWDTARTHEASTEAPQRPWPQQIDTLINEIRPAEKSGDPKFNLISVKRFRKLNALTKDAQYFHTALHFTYFV